VIVNSNKRKEKTRYIIYGAGGIGSVIGGFLFQSGTRVILKGRTSHISAIKENGLLLITSSGRYDLNIPVTDKAEDLRPFRSDDVVLLTAKSQHTPICLSELRAAGAPKDLPICCMQNSIWNESYASRVFDNIYGAMIVVPGFYLDPGEVIHNFSGDRGYIDIGRYPSGTDDVCRKITGDLCRAGFIARTHKRVMKSKSGKCLHNLGNAYSVIKSSKKQEEEFLSIIRDEARIVWKAAGIEFEGLKDFQKRIKSSAKWERWEAPEQKDMDWGGSGWQTLARKAGSSESPRLNGDVADLGRDLNIITPANRAICEISTDAAIQRKAPHSVPSTDLEKLYERYAGQGKAG
jgi:2-dehydropantoate 2-reductase